MALASSNEPVSEQLIWKIESEKHPKNSKFPILVIFKVHKDLFFENFKNLLESAKMRLIWTSSLKFG